ncbi:hypothetical protein BBR47_47320 [Brevibacillus brevis NBRC 100599]|uniref:Uncharacterized protein n=1 Tax=Brevibacillus brevis (strain 47 / JCM 6285 / NBRC 100599) TaxID=358681 RepID=C0ZKN2_BREBN|nr:hypothetical protein BBR47_47320 [Brevibacillus brevis NBRC 100599]
MGMNFSTKLTKLTLVFARLLKTGTGYFLAN